MGKAQVALRVACGVEEQRVHHGFMVASRRLAAVAGLTIMLAAGQSSAETMPNYLVPRKVPEVDTALIISVDVSQSVDQERYRLQMEGIARALEDPDVVGAIVSAPQGRILFTMIAWSDTAKVVVPWTQIASADDAIATADIVRRVPQQGGEFTCLTKMMRIVDETILPSLPLAARRVVLDVSSDGIDNCTPPPAIDEIRDRLVSKGLMVNGNPILVPGENDFVGVGAYRAPGYGLPVGPDTEMTNMMDWYTTHVMGGAGSFVMPANGYDDFGKAIRKKFMMEITFTPRLPLAGAPDRG